MSGISIEPYFHQINGPLFYTILKTKKLPIFSTSNISYNLIKNDPDPYSHPPLCLSLSLPEHEIGVKMTYGPVGDACKLSLSLCLPSCCGRKFPEIPGNNSGSERLKKATWPSSKQQNNRTTQLAPSFFWPKLK